MKKVLAIISLSILSNVYSQISLLKTIDLEYPICRIVHFPKCGDSPLYLCKKTEDVFIVVNGTAKLEISKNENLLFADNTQLFTSLYTEDKITIKKYLKKSSEYQVIKEISLPKKVADKNYYLDIEITNDHLFYFAHQPNTVSKPHDASIDFYDDNLNKVFSIKEDLSIYNIHCFGMDSILVLKEYVYEKTLTTHLYNHSGKLLKEESFQLEFKPSTQSTVNDFLKNDGIIFTLEQTDTPKTHVIKFDHSGKMLWDDVIPQHYYGFSEFDEHLISYGGGDFLSPDYKLIFIDESKGKLDKVVDLKKYYTDFINEKKLSVNDHSFIPFAFNVNPEHTWISFMMSIYTTKGKNIDADRILIFHGENEIQTLDIQLTGNEHPKVVPTDNNHLIVGIGKKVFIYKVK